MGCGVAPDGFVPGDVPSNDFDGDGLPDDFVMYPFDPLPLKDGLGEPVDVIYFGGMNLEPEDGEVAVNVDEPASYPNDEVYYTFDPKTLDDASGEPVDVVEDGELVPIRTLESSDFDPSVIFYTAAPGGVEVQRTNDAGNVQEELAAASTVAIPVRPSASNSLFNAEQWSFVGWHSGRHSVSFRPGQQFKSDKTKCCTSGEQQLRSLRHGRLLRLKVLNSLSPLLGGDTAPSENESDENPVGLQAAESESIDETVSDKACIVRGLRFRCEPERSTSQRSRRNA